MIFNTFLFFTLAAVIVVADKREDYKSYMSHMDRVRNFPCKQPQPRSVTIPLEGLDTSVLYYPTSTVLHRCENAGCCWSSSEVCAHDKYEDVTVVIRSGTNKRNYEYHSINLKNHTSCSCQIPRSTPKK